MFIERLPEDRFFLLSLVFNHDHLWWLLLIMQIGVWVCEKEGVCDFLSSGCMTTRKML